MEWALSVPNGKRLEETLGGDRVNTIGRAAADGLPAGLAFSRLYFGQEFCERALPRADEVLRAVAFCEKAGKEFTLVTPYVTEHGLTVLQGIFEELHRNHVNCEVVANDWGVLHLLTKEFPSLVPVLGRLLNKLWRDPRINSYLRDVPPEDRGLFRTCSLAGPPMQGLLKGLGVDRIEMDNLPQGLAAELPRWGYLVSLYLPYGCITSGRICFFQSWGLRSEEKFRASPRTCARQCEGQWLELRDQRLFSGPADPSCKLVQRGNTVFYRQSPAFVKEGLEQAASLGLSRIVYQPQPL